MFLWNKKKIQYWGKICKEEDCFNLRQFKLSKYKSAIGYNHLDSNSKIIIPKFLLGVSSELHLNLKNLEKRILEQMFRVLETSGCTHIMSLIVKLALDQKFHSFFVVSSTQCQWSFNITYPARVKLFHGVYLKHISL